MNAQSTTASALAASPVAGDLHDLASAHVLPFPTPARRISLIDPEARRRAAITHYLAGCGIDIIPFESVAELMNRPRGSVPVLIMDDAGSIEELINEMKASGVWMPVIAFAEEVSVSRVRDAVRRGAGDYLVWPFSHDEFKAAIVEAGARDTPVSTCDRSEVLASSRIAKLTDREKQVLTGVARGDTSRVIGKRLAISHRTVEKHRENILSKLEVMHTSEAIRLAVGARLLEQE